MKFRTRLLVICAGAAGVWLLFSSPAWAAGEESCFTSKINGARSANGLPPLSTRGDLVSIARRHSGRMASSGTIYHNSNLANEAPSDWQSLGENVGMGPDCAEIHQAFMNSSSHRRNILDAKFNYVGVGVVIASDGTIFVTEVFMQAAASGGGGGSTTTPTTSTGTRPRTTQPRSTAPARPRAQSPPAPPPPPPPPPPPGSQVKGKMASYFDLLEKEAEVSDAVRSQYSEYVKFRRTRDLAVRKETEAAERARRSFLVRALAYLSGAVASGI